MGVSSSHFLYSCDRDYGQCFETLRVYLDQAEAAVFVAIMRQVGCFSTKIVFEPVDERTFPYKV